MKKLISILIIYFYCFNIVNAKEKDILFITTVGSTMGESKAIAINTAYMNGMKVISKSTTRSGNTWITIAKISPRY